jgi:hypothetical protein
VDDKMWIDHNDIKIETKKSLRNFNNYNKRMTQVEAKYAKISQYSEE